MPGPEAKDRKHGRTPNSVTAGEWREYEDVPFEGAPPMPAPPGRKRKWHPMAEKMWKIASVMPHCVDWRDDDWLALEVLIYEIERYYNPGYEEKQTTAQQTEIRRQKNALGIGEQGRKEQKIRYKQKVEPGLSGEVEGASREVVQEGSGRPAGNVVPIKDRRKAILGRGGGAAGEGENGSATG